LFTMLLSVIVYQHKLTSTQWLGTAIVFAGISVEAFVKRKGQLSNWLSTTSPSLCIWQMFTQSVWFRKRRRQR
jgi:EamA domain-containing membrane protein RarD